MPRVLVEVEFSEKGTAVVSQTAGSLRDLDKQAHKTSGALSSIFQGIGQAVGQRAFAAIEGSAVAAAKAIFDMSAALVAIGGQLADLSAKTSLSTDFLQKLGYAGDLVGVSMEEIAAAALKMQKGVADGNDVFARLGLSISSLRAMNPEDQFTAIAAQIAKIKDPTLQAAAAMEVFGKGGAAILPLLRSDIAAAAEEAERLGLVLSEKTISAADALGDEATKLAKAWEAVQNQFVASIVENPELLKGLHRVVEELSEMATWLSKNGDEMSRFTTEAVSYGEKSLGVIEKVGAALIRIGNNPAVRFLNDALL